MLAYLPYFKDGSRKLHLKLCNYRTNFCRINFLRGFNKDLDSSSAYIKFRAQYNLNSGRATAKTMSAKNWNKSVVLIEDQPSNNNMELLKYLTGKLELHMFNIYPFVHKTLTEEK